MTWLKLDSKRFWILTPPESGGPGWTRTDRAWICADTNDFESKYNDDGLWFSYQSEYNLLENLSEHMLVFLSLKTLAFYP